MRGRTLFLIIIAASAAVTLFVGSHLLATSAVLTSGAPRALDLRGAPSADLSTATGATPQTLTPPAPSEFKDRLEVREGYIRLIVQDLEGAESAVRRAAAAVGGYVAGSEGGLGEVRLTVKVPSDRLDQFLAMVREIGPVDQFSVKAEEVGEVYIDLWARLNSTKATERRLLELLQRAQSVDEILKVEQELKRVRSEVERLEAELRSLAGRIAYATVVVHLVGGGVSYHVTLTAEVEDVEDAVRKFVDAVAKAGRISSMQFAGREGRVEAVVATTKLAQLEAQVPGAVVERKVASAPSATGTSTVVVNFVQKKRAYSIHLVLEVDNVEEAMRRIAGMGVGRVLSAYASQQSGEVRLSVPTEEVERLEKSLPGRLVDRRVELTYAPESQLIISLRRPANPLADALGAGLSAMTTVAVWLLAALLALAPVGALAYGAYYAYNKLAKRGARGR
ncbi:DUF4349 domain-containing protein [Pyrobaculum ferrireducens]|uniref:Lipoprotein, putative n=1 Tax=Pyrobaculum ferrireducens TaxID=1104324 RepID=G7VD31_9CREN|nr:DUF4349 domain-containing protein [Pyrobaculum ferrireducens]AET33910.1 lipoprotein, putative [Pyrobaculum ferrireducens]